MILEITTRNGALEFEWVKDSKFSTEAETATDTTPLRGKSAGAELPRISCLQRH
jgi:hypothetical protein